MTGNVIKSCAVEIPFLFELCHEIICLCHAHNKGADQPAHSCSLISAFVIHCLDSITTTVAIIQNFNTLARFCIVAELAVLSLTWSHNPKDSFLMTWLICYFRL